MKIKFNINVKTTVRRIDAAGNEIQQGGLIRRIGHEIGALFKDPPLAQIAADLGAELKGLQITGEFRGVPYACAYRAEGKSNPSHFEINLKTEFPRKIWFRNENKADGFSKTIGLACETQTGDPEFDAGYFIDCDDPEFAAAFTRRPDTRRHIESLFAAAPHVSLLAFSPAGMKARITPCDPDSPALAAETVVNILSHLAALSILAPPVVPSYNPADISEFQAYQTARVVISAIAVASFIFGAVLTYISASRYDGVMNEEFRLIAPSLKYSLPLLAVFLYISFHRLKGRSSSGRVFLGVVVVSALGFFLAGWGALFYTNGSLDTGPAADRVLPIISKWTSGGDSKSYYLGVPSWRSDMPHIGLTVDAAFYDSVKVGDQLEIRTKPGHWNVEWFVYHRKKETFYF